MLNENFSCWQSEIAYVGWRVFSCSSYRSTWCLLLFFPPVAGKLLVSENRTSGCVIAHYLRLGDRSSSISAKICRVSILPADVTSAISYMNSLQVPRVPVKVKFGHLAKNEWVVSFRNQRAVEFSGLLKLRFRLSLQLLLVEYGHLIIIIVNLALGTRISNHPIEERGWLIIASSSVTPLNTVLWQLRQEIVRSDRIE